MKQITLADIFTLLPKADQEAALIHSLEMIFAKSQWPLINALLSPVLHLRGYWKLRANALMIGVKAALRLREYDLAFERFQQLLELGKPDKNIQIKIETLYQMAIQILPARTDMLAFLWESFIPEELPMEALEVWAKIGVLLHEAFSKNRQEGRGWYIKVKLHNHLPESLLNRMAYKLERE